MLIDGSRIRESEITDIEINYNELHIKSVKTIYTATHYSKEWKTKSSVQEKQTNIENIDKIFLKKSKGINAIYITGIIIFALLMVFFSSKEIIVNYKNWLPVLLEHIAVDGFFSMLWLIVGLSISMFLFETPNRALFVKFKDGDKIFFSYYKYRSDKTIREFIDEVKENDAGIRVINKRKITNLKIIVIIFLLICLQLYFAYNSKFERAKAFLDREIKLGNYYTDEEYSKLKFLKTDQILGYNIYENVKTKEKIRIKEEKKLKKQQEYNFLLIKYFSKGSNELIDTKYVPASQINYDILRFERYNKIYYYEQSSNKIYEFNNPDYDFTKEKNYSHVNVEFYINDTKSQNRTKEEQIYNFANSDLDEQKFDTNKKFKKLGKYESKYGTCNIIQGINILYNGENDYYNVIENKEGNYSAIILTFREGFGVSYNNYIDYFKTVVPEK